MVKASELRFGNWVRHTNCICKEEMQLDFGLMKNELSGDEITYPEFEPIKLTPEILEKAGFWKCKNCDDDDLYCLSDFRLEYMEFAADYWNGFYFANDMLKETKVTYLHQLQNLYFALTQTELNIKL